MKSLLILLAVTASAPAFCEPSSFAPALSPGASKERGSAKLLLSEADPPAVENTLSTAQLEQAVKQEPQNASLYLQLGFAYSKLHKVDDAQTVFETAIRLDPSKKAAYFMLGLIYEKKGLTEKAVAAWKAYLERETIPHMRKTALKHLHNLQS